MLLINRTFKLTPGIQVSGGFRGGGHGTQLTPQIPKMKVEFEQEPTTVLNLIYAFIITVNVITLY